MNRASLACVFAVLFFAQRQVVQAAHPLLTEDTGTQGAGRYQLELTHDLGTDQVSSAKTRSRSINVVLSAGLIDSLDVILALPHERLIEGMGATKTTTSGYGCRRIQCE